MKNILYILLLFGFVANAQVNLSTYGAVGDGVADDRAAIQNALDNETNLIADAGKTFRVTGLIAIDQNQINTIDFNNSVIEKDFTTDWVLFINKPNYSNSLTTIKNLEIDGNSKYGQLLFTNSRTNLTNVEVHHAVENDKDSGPRGISITVRDNIGVRGEWLFDNVHIHDIKNTDRTGTPRSQPYGGWGAGMEIFWLEQVLGTGMQFVMINSQINDVYGDEASGLMVNSQLIDISNTNNTLWFENVTIKDCERRAAKMYTGNQTWVNSNIHAVDRTNPNLALDSAPAGLFNIGNRSAAVGSNNNLICGTTFHAAPGTWGSGAMDAWEVDFWFGGDLAKNGTEVEIRNCTFQSGDDPNTSWANAAAQIQLYGEINSFKICNSNIGIASTAARGIKLDKGPNFALQGGEKLQIDSNNTYTNSEAKFVEDFTVTTEYVISDLSGSCAVCPTYAGLPGGTPVTSVEVFPVSDKMLVSGTRQATEVIYPELSDDKTGAWSTSNGAVATVSVGGLITAIGTGSCTITFTTTDGSFTDTVAVTVESSTTEDSIMILKPQGYYTPTSGDADSWDDTSGFELHGTEVGTITFTDEASFDGSSYYDIDDPTDFNNYIPQTDEFTLVWREGDSAPTTGYSWSLAQPGAFQIGPAYNSTPADFQGVWLGGLLEDALTIDPNNNRLFVLIVETNQFNLWADGVQIITNSTNIGTATVTTASPNIGGRTDGSYLMNSGGTLDIVATIPKAISVAEREAIETEFIVNTPPSSDNSTKPASANGEPVYFHGTTKKLLNPN